MIKEARTIDNLTVGLCLHSLKTSEGDRPASARNLSVLHAAIEETMAALFYWRVKDRSGMMSGHLERMVP